MKQRLGKNKELRAAVGGGSVSSSADTHSNVFKGPPGGSGYQDGMLPTAWRPRPEGPEGADDDSYLCSGMSNSATSGAVTRPWKFPGENTGVVCPFLLQGIFLTQ